MWKKSKLYKRKKEKKSINRNFLRLINKIINFSAKDQRNLKNFRAWSNEFAPFMKSFGIIYNFAVSYLQNAHIFRTWLWNSQFLWRRSTKVTFFERKISRLFQAGLMKFAVFPRISYEIRVFSVVKQSKNAIFPQPINKIWNFSSIVNNVLLPDVFLPDQRHVQFFTSDRQNSKFFCVWRTKFAIFPCPIGKICIFRETSAKLEVFTCLINKISISSALYR